jgi:hypothetical protein
MQLVTIPAGSIVQLVGDAQQSGLVDIRFDGRILAMFLRDLEDRGSKILAKAVSYTGPLSGGAPSALAVGALGWPVFPGQTLALPTEEQKSRPGSLLLRLVLLTLADGSA